MMVLNKSAENKGAKATNLLWLQQEVGHVPLFFVVDPNEIVTNYQSLQPQINSLLREFNHDLASIESTINQISKIIDAAQFDLIQISILEEKLNKISTENCILRTSAHLEDTPTVAFAGMYMSTGSIHIDDVEFKSLIMSCWKSLYSEKVLRYLEAHHLSWTAQSFSVIVQNYYEGLFSGVAFIDSIKNQGVLAFSSGSAQQVVEGGNAITLELDLRRDTTLPQQLNNYIYLNNWNSFISALAAVAKKKGKPQDIEWSLNKNDFAIFQTRDITVQLQAKQSEVIWDNTNIAESYPGVTLPLTFSFIRHAYSQVYPNFLSSIGVSAGKIKEMENVFSNLLGHLRGHVYYNVKNWYKLIQILPGYKYNKDFFEAMWNPKRKLISSSSPKGSLLNIFGLIPLALRFLLKLYKANRLIYKFDKNFKYEYRQFSAVDIKALTPLQLAEHYRSVELVFFTAWATPILNDFRVMIFHGLFRSLLIKFLKEEDDHLLSLLLTHHIELSSLDPIRCLQDICTKIRQNNRLLQLFKLETSKEIYSALSASHEQPFSLVFSEVRNYIERFGDRSPSELKLEGPTIREKPEMVIDLLKKYLEFEVRTIVAANHTNAKYSQLITDLKNKLRKQHKLTYFPRWLLLQIILKIAKHAIADREHLRLLRSLAFGLARGIFIQFGVLLANNKQLNLVEDIFYLTREEVLGLTEGHSTLSAVLEVVEERRKIFNEYKQSSPPARRIKTYGFPNLSPLVPDEEATPQASTTSLNGIPASAGVTRGEAICMKEFNSAENLDGKILITLQTDPGWTTVFPLIKGLITERGNILSHAAIVSRELGISSVLAVEGATDFFKTGDLVEVNGSLGTVTLLKRYA